MLVFEISRLYTFVCHLSQIGNLGPRHDQSSRCVRLKGGTQVEFTLMAMELSDRNNCSEFTRPDKCPSCKSPSRLLELRSNSVRFVSFPTHSGTGPVSLLPPRSSHVKFLKGSIWLAGFLSDCSWVETTFSVYSMNN
jgi:hypothetical protein